MESNNQAEKTYLLMDSGNAPLAMGILESPPGGETLQIQVLDDKAEEVAAHEVLQLMSMGGQGPSLQCRLLRRRGERVALQRLAVLDPEVRRNLRVPVKFNSFIYPLTGSWKGRREIQSLDLSCGGVAFYAADGLEVGEQMEIVIPLTDEPLLLRCQVLKRQELRGERVMYAVKFVDMCNDEEVMVRKAVFGIQLRNEPRRAGTEKKSGEAAT